LKEVREFPAARAFLRWMNTAAYICQQAIQQGRIDQLG
jgi:hypothetical protein